MVLEACIEDTLYQLLEYFYIAPLILDYTIRSNLFQNPNLEKLDLLKGIYLKKYSFRPLPMAQQIGVGVADQAVC